MDSTVTKLAMNDYKEFQFSGLMLVFFLSVYAVIVYLYVNELGDRPLGTPGFVLFTVLMMILSVLFYGMTTVINSSIITISFGIGIIRKKISLNRIKSVVTVRNPWYYGWGIRFIPGGMLYNIRGSEGVELTFYDTNRIIRIGTRNPIRLKQEIEQRLKNRSPL